MSGPAFTRAEVAHLTTGGAKACLVGEIHWRATNGLLRGDITVVAGDFPIGAVRFVLNLAAPNKPTFVLTIRGAHCYRLDVNVAHGTIPGTHVQQSDAKGADIDVVDAQNLFPPIPRHGTVGGEQYRATFLAFAKYVGVDPSALDWVDPPEGGP